jgi:hypothetical protein
MGVDKSFPTDAEYARNSVLASMQTVCTPMSPAPVRQHPSRCQPVIGSMLQSSSLPPSTFLPMRAMLLVRVQEGPCPVCLIRGDRASFVGGIKRGLPGSNATRMSCETPELIREQASARQAANDRKTPSEPLHSHPLVATCRFLWEHARARI